VPAIGITGGISTGKTTFCDCLREIMPAATFFNADQAARQLVDLDPEVRKEVAAEFGADIYSAAGDLNRGRLRAIILESAAKKSALEKILHPRIRRQWSAEAQTYRNSSDFFFADIPLLYETGGETLCDRIVVVACSPEIQMGRLQRRGWRRPASGPLEPRREGAPAPPTAAEKMMQSQMPLEEKMKRADHVVWNNAGRDALGEQARLLAQLWRENAWTRN
jgi:dephospho-CoA kinase